MNEIDELIFINSLEKKLSESLQPVNPDPRFIHSLQNRLAQNSDVIVEKRSSLPGILVLGMGLVSGAMLVFLLRKFRA